MISTAPPQNAAVPTTTTTTNNTGNPLKDDPELRRLLAELDSIDTKKNFRRWRTSFLEHLDAYVDETHSVHAQKRYADFAQRVTGLSHGVKKLYAHVEQGHVTADRTTVRARKSLSDLQKRLDDANAEITGMLPGTEQQAAALGYSKFHLGAVLVRDGFVEYDRITVCDEILQHMRSNGLQEVADRQMLEAMDVYHDRLQMFCAVMADLGLYKVMIKCRELLQQNDDNEEEDEDDSAKEKEDDDKDDESTTDTEEEEPIPTTPKPKSKASAKDKTSATGRTEFEVQVSPRKSRRQSMLETTVMKDSNDTNDKDKSNSDDNLKASSDHEPKTKTRFNKFGHYYHGNSDWRIGATLRKSNTEKGIGAIGDKQEDDDDDHSDKKKKGYDHSGGHRDASGGQKNKKDPTAVDQPTARPSKWNLQPAFHASFNARPEEPTSPVKPNGGQGHASGGQKNNEYPTAVDQSMARPPKWNPAYYNSFNVHPEEPTSPVKRLPPPFRIERPPAPDMAPRRRQPADQDNDKCEDNTSMPPMPDIASFGENNNAVEDLGMESVHANLFELASSHDGDTTTDDDDDDDSDTESVNVTVITSEWKSVLGETGRDGRPKTFRGLSSAELGTDEAAASPKPKRRGGKRPTSATGNANDNNDAAAKAQAGASRNEDDGDGVAAVADTPNRNDTRPTTNGNAVAKAAAAAIDRPSHNRSPATPPPGGAAAPSPAGTVSPRPKGTRPHSPTASGVRNSYSSASPNKGTGGTGGDETAHSPPTSPKRPGTSRVAAPRKSPSKGNKDGNGAPVPMSHGKSKSPSTADPADAPPKGAAATSPPPPSSEDASMPYQDSESFGYAVALSSAGDIMASGSPTHGKGSKGRTRVFYWDEDDEDWLQMGQDLVGKSSGDTSGSSVALSHDGHIVAVGSPQLDNPDKPGYVRVYQYNEEDNYWASLGSIIDGRDAGESFGWSVSLSGDGRRLVVGGPKSHGSNGIVRVYQFNGSVWKQLGSDLRGDMVGTSVAASSSGKMAASGCSRKGDAKNAKAFKCS